MKAAAPSGTPRRLFLRLFILRSGVIVSGLVVSLLLAATLLSSPKSPKLEQPSDSPRAASFAANSIAANSFVAPNFKILNESSWRFDGEGGDDKSGNSCPTPKAALIGILSTADDANSLRRLFLREMYAQQNEKLEEHERIDFKFLLGKQSTPELNFLAHSEQLLHPSDTLLTNRSESIQTGKILDWFHYARSILFTPHPTLENVYCKRYRFIGKADDDETINIPLLSKELSKLDTPSSHFIGYPVSGDAAIHHQQSTNQKKLHGMLYFVNAEMVEWIRWSSIPFENQHGIESHQVSKWLHASGVALNIVDWRRKFHETDAKVDFLNQPVSVGETIVMHPCKSTMFWRCLSVMFERINLSHDLLTLPTITTHLQTHYSLTFPPETLQFSVLYMHHLLLYRAKNSTEIPDPSLSISEYEYALLHYTLHQYFPQDLHITPLTDPTSSTIILHMFNLGKRGGQERLHLDVESTRQFLVRAFVEARMLHRGVTPADVDSEAVYDGLYGWVRGGVWKLESGETRQGGVVGERDVDVVLVGDALKRAGGRLGFEEGAVVGEVSVEGWVDRVHPGNMFWDAFLKEVVEARCKALEVSGDGVVEAVTVEVNGIVKSRALKVGELDGIIVKVAKK